MNQKYSDGKESLKQGVNKKIRKKDLRWDKLTGAKLAGADLTGADLTGDGPTSADLDYASIQLSCSFSKFNCGDDLVYQLLDHISTLKFPRKEEVIKILKENNLYAKSHRALDLINEKEE